MSRYWSRSRQPVSTPGHGVPVTVTGVPVVVDGGGTGFVGFDVVG